MTIPRLIVLTVYPLLLIVSLYAAFQTRKLARALPSPAWVTKRRYMVFFAAVQVFGFTQNIIFSRQASWMGALYFCGTLIFVFGLNRFDAALIKSDEALRRYVSEAPEPPVTSGEKDPDFWRKEFRSAIDDRLRPEFLKPEVLPESPTHPTRELDIPPRSIPPDF